MFQPFRASYRRVYLTLVLMQLLILVGCIVSIWAYESYREQGYRERLASTPMALIGYLVDNQPAAYRDAWLEENSRRLGSGLSIVDPVTLGLSGWQRMRLERGQVVIEEGNSGWSLYRLIDDGSRALVMHSVSLSQQLPLELMAMMRDWIQEVPWDARDARFERLRSSSSIAMGMGNGTPDGLSNEQLQRLVDRQVVLNINPSAPSVTLYVMLDDGRWIAVGPVGIFAQAPVWLLYALPLILSLLNVLIGYWMIRRDDRRLNELEVSAGKIAAGDFDVRASIEHDSQFTQLAIKINAMASQVQASLGAQQDLMRAVSHEFRTPVARIRFALQMISDISESETIRRQLGEVDNDIESLDHLIDEILTYARVDSAADGHMPLASEWCDVRSIVVELVEGLAPLHAQLSITHAGFDELWVLADVRYLTRALQNLISNACQYADSRVEIRLERIGRVACLHIDDDGPGVPRSERKRIFQPFARLDGSRARRQPARGQRPSGYGLGLAIVARIVRWHAGRVVVTSSPSLGGARFSLLLPVPQREQSRGRLLRRRRREPSSPSPGPGQEASG
ncbi:ATP-binding protein [Halotalea alkalilenta]|uniref:histidine kinase n=1 Tax=Halotalea alkalilenta TaxID=376489 RepID=A0A172YCI5_9GAMM|nr:ATP-binding protein [Halotalea alkalilenta]ANF56961.1 hypothetical protein A5892_05350 [Halotalea alkalilenta]